jgi:sugar lactone lactonase YvrE
MPRELKVLTEGGRFFEGPRWRDGRWWVSDFYRHAVFTVTPDGRSEKIFDVDHQPSGLGWLPDGSLLVVSMKNRQLLKRSPQGKVSLHADLSQFCPGICNDMVVDARGRAFVGNFGFDLMAAGGAAPTVVVRVDPDGRAQIAANGFLFPNGSVITPDGRTLIVGETIGNRYTAFTIGDDGTLGERRTWALFGPEPKLGTVPEVLPQLKVAPDGCALDAQGQIWAADAVGGRCIRVAEGGRITDEVRAPKGLGVFACMLGGDDGKTLLLCAAPDFFEHKRAHAEEAVLLTTQVDVPHAGLP